MALSLDFTSAYKRLGKLPDTERAQNRSLCVVVDTTPIHPESMCVLCSNDAVTQLSAPSRRHACTVTVGGKQVSAADFFFFLPTT